MSWHYEFGGAKGFGIRRLVLLVLSVLAASCGSGEHEASDPDCDPARLHESGQTTHALSSGGEERTYLLFVPDGYEGETEWPVTLSFHGYGMTAKQNLEVTLGDPPRQQNEELWVFPQGSANRWDKTGNVDVEFTEAVLDDLTQRLCIDERRVFAAGASAGGEMVTRLACDLADRIAAIAPFVGIGYQPANCEGTRPMPLITYVGQNDPFFPLDSVEAACSAWADHNHCDPTPIVEESAPGITLTRYTGCASQADVQMYLIDGLPHAAALADCDYIPDRSTAFGMNLQDLCFEVEGFDHATVIPAFLAAHPMP